MPTYSFIRETAEDRLHERGGEALGPPAMLPCPVCGELLPDEISIAKHLGASHPLTAPRLLIDGAVIVGERILHRHLRPEAVGLANTTELRISENGGPARRSSLSELRRALAESESVILDLTLRNRRAKDSGSVTDLVRVKLDIADPAALAAADRWFEELLARGELDEHQLDRYVDAIAETPGAARYGTALHQYGVAILIKDRTPRVADSLPFVAHRQKLQQSLSVLRQFSERPVARAVCGFIRFGLNDFASGAHPSGVVQLDRCTAALQELVGTAPHRSVPLKAVEAGRCPADAATAFILEHWDRQDATDELQAYGARRSVTAEDAAKCRAFALRAYARGSREAEDLAPGLVNDPVFGTWAARMTEDPVTDD